MNIPGKWAWSLFSLYRINSIWVAEQQWRSKQKALGQQQEKHQSQGFEDPEPPNDSPKALLS